MEMISKYFSWAEVIKSPTASELGIENFPSKLQTRNVLLAAQELDKIREKTGPLIVNSWFRNERLNRAVKGATNSAHLEGYAIDVKSNRYSAYELCNLVKESGIAFDQVIHEYGRWMHISFAPTMRNQCLTKFSGGYVAGILAEEEYLREVS